MSVDMTKWVYINGVVISRTRSRVTLRVTDKHGRQKDMEVNEQDVGGESRDAQGVVWLAVTAKCAHRLKVDSINVADLIRAMPV